VAWRESGLSVAKYARAHRLDRKTFLRWLKALELSQVVALEAERRRELAAGRRRPKLSRDGRSRAVAAFWGMHVEALAWSGLPLTRYAAALRLSAKSLRKWRDRVQAEEVSGDWRGVLHPAARAQISSGLSSAACDDLGLTAGGEPRRRRRFSEAEQRAILEAAGAPGASAAEVCRRHGIATSMLFRWRRQLGESEEARLVSIALSDGALADLLPNLGSRTAP
jgi:transposase-like protein